LPNERAAVSKSGVLHTIFTQTLSFKDPKMAVHALNIAKLQLSVRNGIEIKQIVSFIETVIHQFESEPIQVLAFQILY
jgi:hypothetical protein